MFLERGAWRIVVAFVVLFLVGEYIVTVKANHSEYVDWECGRNGPLSLTGRKSEKPPKGDASKKLYKIAYSDHVDVNKLKKLQNDHFDYYNFFGDQDLNPSGNKNLIINKCCSWNSHFNVENYNCIKNVLGHPNLSEPLSVKVNQLSNHVFVESVPNCGSNSVLSVRVVPKVRVDETGVFVEGERFSEYCLDEDPRHPNQTIVLTCHDPKVFCKNKPCFRKCCPLKQSYEQFGRKCRETNQAFDPEFVEFPKLTPDKSVRLERFGLYLGDACEKQGKYLLERDEGELSYLDSTGTLYVPLFKKCFSKDDFCIEHVKMENSSEIGSFLCFESGSTHFENSRLQYILLSLGLIISSMFLLLTFLAYLFSPKTHNLYGKTLMCYIACLFTAYLSLAVVELKSTELTKFICVFMGYIILFSFLAAFFWLNVISFDIWKTFRTTRNVERSTAKKSKNIRFLWYSLYAWTFPCAITAVCSLANRLEYFPFKSIKPDIGEENCWFSRQTYGIYVFFIAPISILIVANIIFYIQTAWRIWKVRSDIAKMGKQKRKKFTANKDQFLINGKLFIIMGITWSLEIISFFAPHPIWYITDTANALHGVFIFAVFVLKKKVYQQVFQWIRHPLKNMKHLSSPGPAQDSSANKNSNSSNRSKFQTEGTRVIGTSASDSKT